MPKLNDYFLSDLNFFIHTDEFATEANVGGTVMKIIIDDDLLKEHNMKKGEEGLAKGEFLFHVAKSNFSETNKPFIGKSIVFDKKHYRISDIQDSAGLYTITLEGYHS